MMQAAGIVAVDVSHAQLGGQSIDGFRAIASFGREGRGCRFQSLGSCTAVQCVTGDAAPHAGAITLAAGPIPVALQPGPSGAYPTLWAPVSPWKSGDTVRVRATGAAGSLEGFEDRLPAPASLLAS